MIYFIILCKANIYRKKLSKPFVQPCCSSQAGWGSEPSLVKDVPAHGREFRTRSLRSLPAQTILWFCINFWPVLFFHSCLSPVCGSNTDSWRDNLFVQEPNSWQSCCLGGMYCLESWAACDFITAAEHFDGNSLGSRIPSSWTLFICLSCQYGSFWQASFSTDRSSHLTSYSR